MSQRTKRCLAHTTQCLASGSTSGSSSCLTKSTFCRSAQHCLPLLKLNQPPARNKILCIDLPLQRLLHNAEYFDGSGVQVTETAVPQGLLLASRQPSQSSAFRELASSLFVCCHLTSFTFVRIYKKNLFMPRSQIKICFSKLARSHEIHEQHE